MIVTSTPSSDAKVRRVLNVSNARLKIPTSDKFSRLLRFVSIGKVTWTFRAHVNSCRKKFRCCGSKNIKPSMKISALATVGDCSKSSAARASKSSSSVSLSVSAARKSSAKIFKSRNLSRSSSSSTLSAAASSLSPSRLYVRNSLSSSDKNSANPCCLAARTKNFRSAALSRRRRIFRRSSRRPMSDIRGESAPPTSSRICRAKRLKLCIRVLTAPPVNAASSSSARYVW